MRSLLRQSCLLGSVVGLAVTGIYGNAAEILHEREPLPVSAELRVSSSAPRVGLFNALTEDQKTLARHLHDAALAGKDLIYFQSHRHSLLLRDFLKYLLGDATRRFSTRQQLGEEAYGELVAYAAKFNANASPYSPSNRKYFLQKVPAERLKHLLEGYSRYQRYIPIDETSISEIVRLLTDRSFEVLRQPESETDDLPETGGNLYEKGITKAELETAAQRGFQADLNCHVKKQRQSGQIYCEKMTTHTPGVVGQALRKVVASLELALPFAQTEHQRQEIQSFIRYFRFGNVEDFRQANIHWVQDRAQSVVDFMMGFVEVYDDYQGRIGSWESYVQIVDPVTTQVSQRLAQNAQYFEDKMPYGPWKKQFPSDYAPPALMVYYFQELASMNSGGYNLPNFDDIRRDVGFKNIIRLELPGQDNDPQTRDLVAQAYGRMMDPSAVELAKRHRALQRRVLVLLHEIIGHGSGTYDVTRYGPQEDPISALGAAGGSALEEQRADLAALVFAADPKLVDVGIYANESEAKDVRNSMYDNYLFQFLLRFSRDRSVSESHARGHWLLVKRLLDRGVIQWIHNDSTVALKINDYDQFWAQCVELLGILQTIKATRDDQGLRRLLATDAPLDLSQQWWPRAVISAGENLAINAGSVEQPWRITSFGTLELKGDLRSQSSSLESIAPWL